MGSHLKLAVENCGKCLTRVPGGLDCGVYHQDYGVVCLWCSMQSVRRNPHQQQGRTMRSVREEGGAGSSTSTSPVVTASTSITISETP